MIQAFLVFLATIVDNMRKRKAKLFVRSMVVTDPWTIRMYLGDFVHHWENFPPRVQVLIHRQIRRELRSSCTVENFMYWLKVLHFLESDKNVAERKKQSAFRRFATEEWAALELRRYGHDIPADIEEMHIRAAVSEGSLRKLLILCACPLPEAILRACMERARTRNIPAALECARMLKDYRAIAEIFAESGTSEQMLAGKNFLEGRVSAEHL